MNGAPLFELCEAGYHYGSQPAVCGLSLTVAAGERVVLLGANGSGKSTLLRLLDALYFPDAGSVRFCGRELTEKLLLDDEFSFDFRRRVGLVFQNPDVQLFNPTVYEEVAFGPLQLRWPREKIEAQVAQAMEFMQVSHLRNRPPYRLSGGEKKRVALASVLVMDPEVLLLDEPTAALDPRSQSRIIDLIATWKSGERTVITATQQLDIVEEIADQAYVLHEGRMVGGGAPRQVLADLELLDRCNLVHAHRHRHEGVEHSHPHRHGHGSHEHKH